MSYFLQNWHNLLRSPSDAGFQKKFSRTKPSSVLEDFKTNPYDFLVFFINLFLKTAQTAV